MSLSPYFNNAYDTVASLSTYLTVPYRTIYHTIHNLIDPNPDLAQSDIYQDFLKIFDYSFVYAKMESKHLTPVHTGILAMICDNAEKEANLQILLEEFSDAEIAAGCQYAHDHWTSDMKDLAVSECFELKANHPNSMLAGSCVSIYEACIADDFC